MQLIDATVRVIARDGVAGVTHRAVAAEAGTGHTLIGQTYEFKVIKFNKKRGNIVLSRRVLLEKERDQIKSQTLQTLEEGKVVKPVLRMDS